MNEPLKLGLAGLGTVGQGVINLLEQNGGSIAQKIGRPLEIIAVSARDKNKQREINIDEYEWFESPVELANNADIDIFIELIGGEEGAALEATKAALSRPIDVVTANKAMLAHHGLELAKLAEANNKTLLFEAAVAGGIPIIKTLKESLSGNQIKRIYGILNGTCNYILTRMQNEGRNFGEILSEAQQEGYAEADPSFDIGGIDAAHKLALLTGLGFGTELSFKDVYTEGIESISPEDIVAADALGYRIKLLGVAVKTDDGIEQRVHPALVPKHSAISEVSGVTNCVCVDGDFVGKVMLIGPGAGRDATASSVVGDIIDAARQCSEPVFARPTSELRPYQRAPLRAHEGGYYVRLSLIDRPGSFAAIATRMAQHGISLESIVQRRHRSPADKVANKKEGPAPVVMITHQTTERAISEALEEIENDGHIQTKPVMIRIEYL